MQNGFINKIKDLHHLKYTEFIFSLVLVATLAMPHPGVAQQKNISYTNLQWFQYYNHLKLNEHWSILTDGGIRFKDAFRKSSQYIIRSGLGYNLTPGLRLTAGFAHLGFYDTEGLYRIEYRPYQEISAKTQYGKINCGHRLRIEERFFSLFDPPEDHSKNTFNFRFRYRLLLNITILDISSGSDDKQLLLNLGDEVLLNAGKNITNEVFDQNRLLIGPGIRINKALTVNFIYNHLFSATNLPNQFRQAYTFWVGVKHTISLM